MNRDEYLADRLDTQISWYDSKSTNCKRRYLWSRGIEITCAAFIPFIAGLGNDIFYGRYFIGLLGILVALAAGSASLFRFQENWVAYRTVAETLKHQKHLFLTDSPPYDDGRAFTRLVQCVEGLISRENSQWAAYTKSSDEKDEVHKLE
jgi:Protein of unknown function (DUF4231)